MYTDFVKFIFQIDFYLKFYRVYQKKKTITPNTRSMATENSRAIVTWVDHLH